MDKLVAEIYHLAPGNLKRLAIQKTDWPHWKPIHIETVEISPSICCFEYEAEQEFRIGDELRFHFDLEDRSLSMRAAILAVDRCEFLDEGYEHKTWFAYCAQFDGELDRDFFKQIVGPQRICKSLYRVKWAK